MVIPDAFRTLARARPDRGHHRYGRMGRAHECGNLAPGATGGNPFLVRAATTAHVICGELFSLPIRPAWRVLRRSDRLAWRELFARLSPEIRYLRFCGPKSRCRHGKISFPVGIRHREHEALIGFDAITTPSVAVPVRPGGEDPRGRRANRSGRCVPRLRRRRRPAAQVKLLRARRSQVPVATGCHTQAEAGRSAVVPSLAPGCRRDGPSKAPTVPPYVGHRGRDAACRTCRNPPPHEGMAKRLELCRGLVETAPPRW